jgi:adenosylhomocysteine nucleosidase
MKGNIAIIAALRGELRPFVTHAEAKSWKRLPSAKGTEVWEYRHADGCWLAACAGMGQTRAAVAFAEAEKIAPLDAVCSVGWAGALDGNLRSGAVCNTSLVIDTKTGERFRPAQWESEAPILVTTPDIADPNEKKRLVASYGAGLVDMEAATIARIALGKGIPFYCMKAVSDEAGAQLPDINGFIGTNGQLKMLPFLVHVAIRPASWPALARLGRNSAAAAKNLAEALYNWLDERAYSRRDNGDYATRKKST